MKHVGSRSVLMLGLATAGWLWNGEVWPTTTGGMVASVEAFVGVARRSTVGAGAPGVGVTPGAGAGAPGVGVTPGNAGRPVNRVGVR